MAGPAVKPITAPATAPTGPERQLLTEPARLHLPRAPEQAHMRVQMIAPLRLQQGVSLSYYPMAGGRTWLGICQVVVVAIRTMWRGTHSGLPASRYRRRSIPHQVQTSVSKSKLWPPAHRSSAYHRPRRKDRITLAVQESSPIRRIEGDFATQWRQIKTFARLWANGEGRVIALSQNDGGLREGR